MVDIATCCSEEATWAFPLFRLILLERIGMSTCAVGIVVRATVTSKPFGRVASGEGVCVDEEILRL